jgi:exonuclease SbcC
MIPHYLSLRNFLSYREPAELDLRGLHLACISGLNGAGKSTILDGITWALFGKSRVKSDDDLVNRVAGAQGAAAEVIFIFELEGAIYRIIRRKAIGKTTELEFHAQTIGVDGAERWQVKTEARIKDTQAEIEKLLRMNYEVFINASFLLQGKADEFTTKTADRRKEILAEILGVNQWDVYKDLAAERRKESEHQAVGIDRQLAEVDAELSREDEFRRALELAEATEQAAVAERERQGALVALAQQNKMMADQQRESLRQTTADLAEAEGELRRIESLAAQRRADLETYQLLLDRREHIEANFAAWQAAESEANEWEAKSELVRGIAAEKHPLELAIARAETQLEGRQRELEARGERAANAVSEQQTILSRLGEKKAQLEKLAARAGQFSEQERLWQEARARLQEVESNRKLWQQELIQLRSRAGEIERWLAERDQMERSRKAATNALVAATKSLDEIAIRRQELTEKSTEIAGLNSAQERLEKEGKISRSRLDQLQGETGGDCPVCGQPLTEEHRNDVLHQLQTEVDTLASQFRRNRSQLTALEKEANALKKALERQPILEKERNNQQAAIARVEGRLGDIERSLAAWQDSASVTRIAELERLLADEDEELELRARLAEFQSAADEGRRLNQEIKILEHQIAHDEARAGELERLEQDWEQVGRPALAETRRQLAENAYAQAERAALAAIDSRLIAVAYDATAHNAALARRDELAGAPEQHHQLENAVAAVKPLEEALEDQERQRERTLGRVVDLRSRCAETTKLLQELEAGLGDLQTAEAELNRLREKVAEAIRITAGARQRVDVLKVRHEDEKRLTAVRQDVARLVSLLRQLEEACGRKGVQALLIEAALPEIEEYANDLLMQLTGGEMRIRFETQRSRKKDDSQIETLDILISDSTGDRPYENYSGGEQFRVNFAVRLALSQVLARRAGARLRTLVIDEGFGSQDPEGRQRLVEAINAVQEKFACILVITHIDELRDKFPARIDVERTAAGSRLAVVTI